MLRPSSGIAVESAAEPWETTVCFRATSSVNPTNSNGLRTAQGSIQSTNKTILVQGETSYVDRKEYSCSTMITMAESMTPITQKINRNNTVEIATRAQKPCAILCCKFTSHLTTPSPSLDQPQKPYPERVTAPLCGFKQMAPEVKAFRSVLKVT